MEIKSKVIVLMDDASGCQMSRIGMLKRNLERINKFLKYTTLLFTIHDSQLPMFVRQMHVVDLPVAQLPITNHQ